MDGSIQLLGVRGPRLEFNSNKPDIYWTFFSICKEFIQFLDPTFIGSRFLIPAKGRILAKEYKTFCQRGVKCQSLESDINRCLHLIFIIH